MVEDNKKEIKVLKYGFNILKNGGDEQLKILKEIKDQGNQLNDYFYTKAKRFWEDADFLIYLVNDDKGNYSFYPYRSMLEIFSRILLFSKSNEENRRLIICKESLMECKKYYVIDKEDEYKECYKKFNNCNLPDIDSVKPKKDLRIDNVFAILEKSDIGDWKEMYNTYFFPSNMIHGSYLQLKMDQNNDNLYKVSNFLKLSIRVMIEMLKVVDYFLDKETENLVNKIILESENLFKENNLL